jgi:hypothetical protein
MIILLLLGFGRHILYEYTAIPLGKYIILLIIKGTLGIYNIYYDQFVLYTYIESIVYYYY